MSLSGVDALVRTRLGLDPESLGATALSRAVAQRMKATGAATTDDYLALATATPAEQLALAAELAVPETWFFRGERVLFDSLARFVADRAMTRSPVRVLSVPCSTGEEPYSLAIALEEQQVPPAGYRIEGVDLSAAHLTRARAGHFTTFAFRDSSPDVRDRHFQEIGGRWELRPALRERVRFRAGNATEPNFLDGEDPFDLILCRNLFIYLTDDARRRALANLDRLLTPTGRLVLSPAEADRLPPSRFITTGPPEFGVYCRANVNKPVAPVANATPPPARKPAPRPEIVAPPRVVLSEPPAPPVTLEAARELANVGQLTAARAICERLLAKTAGDPNIYALLGAVALADGRAADAAEAFRKALYLDPHHLDALGHMIVILDQRGDAVQAAALRKRLARATREGRA